MSVIMGQFVQQPAHPRLTHLVTDAASAEALAAEQQDSGVYQMELHSGELHCDPQDSQFCLGTQPDHMTVASSKAAHSVSLRGQQTCD